MSDQPDINAKDEFDYMQRGRINPNEIIMKKYQETLYIINESQKKETDLMIFKSIIEKLTKFYNEQGSSITQTAEFDQQFEMTLNTKEREVYDDIVIEAYQKNQPTPVEPFVKEQQQFPKIQPIQVQQVKQIRQQSYPQLFKSFDDTLIKLMDGRGRPDQKDLWHKSQNRSEFQKLLAREEKDNIELIDRIACVDLFNHYYSDILLNYLEIPLKTIDDKFRKRQEEAQKLLKKILDLVTNQQQIVVKEQKCFFNSLINVKYFYKFYKLRTLGGKEREYQVSMKKILFINIFHLYDKYQQSKPATFDLKELLRLLYQELKIKTNEIEYSQLFNLIKDVKKCLIVYYRFRTFFIYLIQLLSTEFMQQSALADILISQSMKCLQQIQNSREKKDFGELAEVIWTQIKNCEYQNIPGPKQKQMIERLEVIEQQLKRINQSTKNISLVLESLLNRTTNLGMEMYLEFLKSKNWSRTSEIFNDIYEWEVRWLITGKEFFGNLKEFLMMMQKLKIRDPRDARGTTNIQIQIEEGKLEFFGWVQFILSKQNLMAEQLMTINEEKSRLEAQKTLEIFIFNDPEITKRFVQISQSFTQKDRDIIENVIKTLEQERRLSGIMRDFIQKFQINLEKSEKKQYNQLGECMRFQLKHVLDFSNKNNYGHQMNNYFYYSAGIYLYLYFVKDVQRLIYNVHEFLEKFRFLSLGLCLCESNTGQNQNEINTLGDIVSHVEVQTSIDNHIQNKSLENQFILAQKLYNYAVQIHNCTNDKLQPWNDQFPQIKIDTSIISSPKMANNVKFNLNCFLTQFIINHKTEQKLIKNVEVIHKIIKYIRETNYAQDDFKSIFENNKQYQEPVQKFYIDVRNYKNLLEKELLSLESNQPTAHKQFKSELFEIFCKYFSKAAIMKSVEKIKLELKIPLNKEEILSQTQQFWEQKFNQYTQQVQQQSDPKYQQQQQQLQTTQTSQQQVQSQQWQQQDSKQHDQMKSKFSQLLQSFRKLEKDGFEFYKDVKFQIDQCSTSSDRFIKDNTAEFYKLLDKYFPQATPPQVNQIITPITPVIQPRPQRPSSLINQAAIVQKLQIIRKKNGFAQPNEEEQQQLIEFIQEKFVQYMKQFLGKVFQAAVAQNAGDEIKVYQAQSGNGLQQMLEGDKNSEIRIKQLTELFSNYGPKKEGDFDTTLLTSGDQPIKQIQYTLCDLTPISRQPDFGKYLLEVDRQQEELLRNKIKMKKWRNGKPELQDILSKKIKRGLKYNLIKGTDLGDAIQSFLLQRVQSEQEKNEGEVEQDPQDESDKIKSQLLKSLKQAQDVSATTTRIQMQNRLRNMESNNHLVKRKEINVRTVQSVLEGMALYRKSKILQRSYLF